MPSAPDAWLALNGVAELPVTEFSNSVLIGPETNLPFLGDIFVLPRPWPFANVFSIGDVFIGIGAACSSSGRCDAGTTDDPTSGPSSGASLDESTPAGLPQPDDRPGTRHARFAGPSGARRATPTTARASTSTVVTACCGSSRRPGATDVTRRTSRGSRWPARLRRWLGRARVPAGAPWHA